MAPWWLWCVLCLPSPWQLGSVPGPGSPSHVTWPGSGLSLVRGWGRLLIGRCHHNMVGDAQRRAWGVNSLSLRRIEIFLARCVTRCYISSHLLTITCDAREREAKDPTQRRISSNHRDEKRKRVIKCFPISCQTFLVWNLSWFHVKGKKIKLKTFTLDMSIHHQLFHKLWS